MYRGMVALSADPIHLGHLDLFRKALEKCSELLVVVLNNDFKKYTFTLSERIQMTERAVKQAELSNVTVIGSDGVLADVYIKYACSVLFRGIRNNQDRQYEEHQFQYHEAIFPPEARTFPKMKLDFIPAHAELALVSSSAMKVWTTHFIDTSRYVPLFVKQALEERLCKQYKIAVTGGISVGKSWVCEELARRLPSAGVISMDKLIRKLYDEDSEGARLVRSRINEVVVKAGGNSVINEVGTIDRKALGSFLFNDVGDCLKQIQSLTVPHVIRLYREALKELHATGCSVVIFEWAQLAEMNMSSWTNNNVVIVDSPDRKTLVEKRSLDIETVERMSKFQWSFEQKVAKLTETIRQAGTGGIVQYQNSVDDPSALDGLAEDVKKVIYQ